MTSEIEIERVSDKSEIFYFQSSIYNFENSGLETISTKKTSKRKNKNKVKLKRKAIKIKLKMMKVKVSLSSTLKAGGFKQFRPR